MTTMYPWIIVAACFCATLVQGAAMWTYGIFFKPLAFEFGWSRAMVSSGYTSFLIGFSISVVIAGRLADRHNTRLILFVSALSAGLGTYLCGYTQTITYLRLCLFLAGLGIGGTWSVPTSSVQKWFYGKPRAGLALAIVTAGVGVGVLLFAPLTNSLILDYGWRGAYQFVGMIFFCIILLSALVIRSDPARISKHPAEISSPIAPYQPATKGRVLTTYTFMGLVFTQCVAQMALQILSVHLVPYATDVGVSRTASAAALGLLGGFSIPGRLLSGLASEKLTWRQLMILSLFAMGLLFLGLLLIRTTWMLYGFVFFYGIFHGARVAAYLGCLSDFFGTRSLGELIGISYSLGAAAGAFAPYLAGSIFDATGSYFVVFTATLTLLIVSSVLIRGLKQPTQSR